MDKRLKEDLRYKDMPDELEKMRVLYDLAVSAHEHEDKHLQRLKQIVLSLFPFIALTFIPATLIFVRFTDSTNTIPTFNAVIVYIFLVFYLLTFFVSGIFMFRAVRRLEAKTGLSADAEDWLDKTKGASSLQVYEALLHMQMSFVEDLRGIATKRYAMVNILRYLVAANFISFVVYATSAGYAIFFTQTNVT